jgi:hypothetical protein
VFGEFQSFFHMFFWYFLFLYYFSEKVKIDWIRPQKIISWIWSNWHVMSQLWFFPDNEICWVDRALIRTCIFFYFCMLNLSFTLFAQRSKYVTYSEYLYFRGYRNKCHLHCSGLCRSSDVSLVKNTENLLKLMNVPWISWGCYRYHNTLPVIAASLVISQ